VTSILAFALTFISPRDAIWAFALNFVVPGIMRRFNRDA
jgi:hypothetical protein